MLITDAVIDRVMKEAYPRERKVSRCHNVNESFTFRWVET